MIGAAARVLIVTDARDDDALIDLLSAGLEDLKGKRRSGAAAPRILEVVRAQPPVVEDPALTERQTDVLRLLSHGRSNKEIARELGVSPATVKTHVAQLIAILGAANRTDAAMRAGLRGLL